MANLSLNDMHDYLGLFQKIRIHPYGGPKLHLWGKILAKLIESGGIFSQNYCLVVVFPKINCV